MRLPDLSRAKVVVIVWYQDGCGACDEYLPRFKRLAARYQSCLPILYVDTSDPDPQAQALQERFPFKYTPTTMLLRRPRGSRIWPEALDDAAIERVLQLAVRGLSCEI